jgi:hypothetical protein
MTGKLLFHRNISTKESSLSGQRTLIYPPGENPEKLFSFQTPAGAE